LKLNYRKWSNCINSLCCIRVMW